MSAALLELAGVQLRPGAAALSFAVPAGVLTALLGQNGAGKTRLIDIACGRVAPVAGQVRVAGRDIAGLGVPAVAGLGLARVWRHPPMLAGLTALEMVQAGGYALRGGFWAGPRAARGPAAGRARALLARVGLEDRAETPMLRLHDFELRRLDIARALAAEPSLLLLDEPAAGLRAAEAEALGELLRGLCADGLAVLVAEHGISFVMAHCARVLVLERGEILADGAPQACLDIPDVQEALLGRQQDADRLRARS